MVAKDINGKSIPVPGLIVNDIQGARRYARSIQRKTEATSRSSRFDPANFKIEEHLAGLATENIKLDL